MGFIAFWSEVISQLVESLFARKTKTDVLPGGLSFSGKSVLITGATSGLGLEAAIHYVNLGASPVIITARTSARGNDAKFQIEQRTGKKDVIQVRVLNMDTFEGVKTFVKSLRENVEAIDIVLLNAGIHNFDYKQLPDGYEADIQVNALSTLLLGLLLLPWMRDIRRPDQIQHLNFVGSSSHYSNDISKWPSYDVLKFHSTKERFVSALHNYAVSKLVFQYGARELTKLAVDESGNPSPIVNVVCPGMIRTNIARGFAGRGLIFKLIEEFYMSMKANPADVGARSLILVATTTPDQHGAFKSPMLSDQEYAIKSAPMLTSPEGKRMQAQVWKEIQNVLLSAAPEISDTIG